MISPGSQVSLSFQNNIQRFFGAPCYFGRIHPFFHMVHFHFWYLYQLGADLKRNHLKRKPDGLPIIIFVTGFLLLHFGGGRSVTRITTAVLISNRTPRRLLAILSLRQRRRHSSNSLHQPTLLPKISLHESGKSRIIHNNQPTIHFSRVNIFLDEHISSRNKSSSGCFFWPGESFSRRTQLQKTDTQQIHSSWNETQQQWNEALICQTSINLGKLPANSKTEFRGIFRSKDFS